MYKTPALEDLLAMIHTGAGKQQLQRSMAMWVQRLLID